jgi:hypothetical protein
MGGGGTLGADQKWASKQSSSSPDDLAPDIPLTPWGPIAVAVGLDGLDPTFAAAPPFESSNPARDESRQGDAGESITGAAIGVAGRRILTR